MKKNSSKLWDKLWKEPVSIEQDLYNLKVEEMSVRWERIAKIIKDRFQSFDKLRVVEIGAGAGTNAALFAKRGAKVTILDYSPEALKRSREFFKRNKLKANFVNANALNLPKELIGKFDVSMSFGLTEHFLKEKRFQINKSHLDVLRKGGLFFISVPNKFNPPYRVFKFLAERFGYWKVGEEYPYSMSELKNFCKKLLIDDYGFIGDSFYWSLSLIDPIKIYKKIRGVKNSYNLSSISKEKGTFIDKYISYSLVLWGEKP